MSDVEHCGPVLARKLIKKCTLGLHSDVKNNPNRSRTKCNIQIVRTAVILFIFNENL